MVAKLDPRSYRWVKLVDYRWIKVNFSIAEKLYRKQTRPAWLNASLHSGT